jgi:hypothetical protein
MAKPNQLYSVDELTKATQIELNFVLDSYIKALKIARDANEEVRKYKNVSTFMLEKIQLSNKNVYVHGDDFLTINVTYGRKWLGLI